MRRTITTLTTSCSILFLAGCSGGGSSSPAFRVETSNVGSSTAPHEPRAAVEVRFTLDVEPATLIATTVFLETESGMIAPTILGYDAATRGLSILPQPGLASGALYRLVVTEAVRSVDGRPLEQEFRAEFRTADRRTWVPQTVVAVGFNNVFHLAVDAADRFQLLTGDATVGGEVRLYRSRSGGGWDAPETVGAPIYGLDLGDGSEVLGGLKVDTPGTRVLRTGGTWQSETPIAIQPQPPMWPVGEPWPDPFRYQWRGGEATTSAVRVGPLVPSVMASETAASATLVQPVCKVLTATAEIDVPYGANESVWTAMIAPGAQDFVLGARDGTPRVAWAWAPGAAQRTVIGPIPSGRFWDATVEGDAFGQIAAAWILDRSVDPDVPPFTPELSVARFDPGVGWSGVEPLALRDTDSASPQMEIATGPTGDVALAWSLDDGDATRTLELAHYRGGIGWSFLTLSDVLSEERISFDVVFDAAGQVFVAWAEQSLADRALKVRRFDSDNGWSAPENLAMATAQSLRQVRLAANSQGQVLVVWNRFNDVLSRRYQ